MRFVAVTHKIPVIMYDQLGCGNSTHLPEKMGDGDFWTPDLFLAELDNLLSHRKTFSYALIGYDKSREVMSYPVIALPRSYF